MKCSETDSISSTKIYSLKVLGPLEKRKLDIKHQNLLSNSSGSSSKQEIRYQVLDCHHNVNIDIPSVVIFLRWYLSSGPKLMSK